MSMMTSRFTEALDYARVAHAGQCRKGCEVPYLSHLLGVAGLVMEYGGNEDQAIAGLLHDVLEDCGAHHAGPIGERFGERVLAIVRDCTDGSAEDRSLASDADARRRDWWQRKRVHLQHMAQEPDASLLVGGCDKLHNARTIVHDLEDPSLGPGVFERFTASQDGTLRYYASVGRILRHRNAPMARAFEGVVERMHALAGVRERGFIEVDG